MFIFTTFASSTLSLRTTYRCLLIVDPANQLTLSESNIINSYKVHISSESKYLELLHVYTENIGRRIFFPFCFSLPLELLILRHSPFGDTGI